MGREKSHAPFPFALMWARERLARAPSSQNSPSSWGHCRWPARAGRSRPHRDRCFNPISFKNDPKLCTSQIFSIFDVRFKFSPYPFQGPLQSRHFLVRSTAHMRGRLFLGFAILITTLSIGCGGGSTANRKVAAGDLTVSPSTLDFGQVEVGKVQHQTGTLTAGDSTITVTSADWSGDGYSVSGIVFPTASRWRGVPRRVRLSVITCTVGRHPRAPSRRSTRLYILRQLSPTPGLRAEKHIFM